MEARKHFTFNKKFLILMKDLGQNSVPWPLQVQRGTEESDVLSDCPWLCDCVLLFMQDVTVGRNAT